MLFYNKTDEKEKKTEIERVQKRMEAVLKKNTRAVLKTAFKELVKVGYRLDDMQRCIRPIIHNAILAVYARDSESITADQHAQLMSSSSPSGHVYRLAFKHLMNCKLDEDIASVLRKLTISAVSSEHMKEVLKKYLNSTKPSITEIAKIFKKVRMFYSSYSHEKMANKMFAAVREYLNDPQEYKKFRALLVIHKTLVINKALVIHKTG